MLITAAHVAYRQPRASRADRQLFYPVARFLLGETPPLPAKGGGLRQRGEINIVGGGEGQGSAPDGGGRAAPAPCRRGSPALAYTKRAAAGPRGGWCRVPPGVSRRVSRPAHRVRRPAGRRRRRFRPAEYQKKDPASCRPSLSWRTESSGGRPIVCRRALARSIQLVDFPADHHGDQRFGILQQVAVRVADHFPVAQHGCRGRRGWLSH